MSMLSPVVARPQNLQTYAQALIARLSQAREYMAAIMQEHRLKHKEYFDIGRKTTVVVEQMPNGDNYRLEHVETGQFLDPTIVDKLVKVEPWSINRPNPEQLNPNSGEDTPPEIPSQHLSA